MICVFLFENLHRGAGHARGDCRFIIEHWHLQRHMNLNDKSEQGSEGIRVMNVRICHTPALMVLLTAVSLSFLISSLDFRQEA